MKAKEYFEKYNEKIMEESETPNMDHSNGPAAQMYYDFVGELKELIRIRNVRYDRGAFSSIREINQKWNAVVNLFEQKYGRSPIKRDGFEKQVNISIGITKRDTVA